MDGKRYRAGLPMVFAAVLVIAPGVVAQTIPAFAIVAEGQASGVTSQRFEVVRTADEFAELWADHAGAAQLPVVDFNTTMVVAAFLGQRPTGGYAVNITGVLESPADVAVTITTQVPSADCIVTQAFTEPFQMVMLTRSDKVVRFDQVVAPIICSTDGLGGIGTTGTTGATGGFTPSFGAVSFGPTGGTNVFGTGAGGTTGFSGGILFSSD